MDTRTGEIVEHAEVAASDKEYFLPVKREITAKERAEKQILLYGSCGCGSGKKFKFCCHRKGSRQ